MFLKNPKIILLDEATSALDAENEVSFQEALEKLLESEQKTTVIVAHRLSTIRKADKICFIDCGKVIEMGSHEDLMKSECSLYRDFVEKQEHLSTGGRKRFRRLSSSSNDQLSISSHLDASSIHSSSASISELYQLKFNNVFFTYPSRPDKFVLTGFSLSIRKGETLAIAGKSGDGKSTIVSLIERLYDPTSGTIQYENIDLKELNVRWFRDQIGYVGQTPTLFNDTIANNISYGCSNFVSRMEIEVAAKASNAHDFIMSFPDGYNTRVGINGCQLSGGQKQRIAIARALVKNPKILILDEATSALDSESESRVQETLFGLMSSNEHTIIVISHNLSAIEHVDKIAFVSRGRIKKIGTHDYLMSKTNGMYRSLVQAQKMKSFVNSTLSQESFVKEESLELNVDVNEEKMEGEIIDEIFFGRVGKIILKEWKYLFLGCIGAIFAGSSSPVSGVLLGLITDVLFKPVTRCDESNSPPTFETCQEYWYYTAYSMEREGATIAFFLSARFLGILSGYVFLFIGFRTVSERMIKDLRDELFGAICCKEMSFFDKQRIDCLTSQLDTEVKKVQDLIGQPIRTFFVTTSAFVVGLTVSFVYMRPLALLVTAMIPLMILSELINMNKSIGQDEGHVSMEDKKVPGVFVQETLTKMRTVSSFCLEEKFCNNYLAALKESEKNAATLIMKDTVLTAMSFCFRHCLVLAIEFYWGGWVLLNYPEYFSFRDFCISIYSFNYIFFALNASGVGVDREGGKTALKNMFKIIDQKSQIDPISGDGKRLY